MRLTPDRTRGCRQIASRGGRIYAGLTPRDHCPNRPDRVSHGAGSILRGPNPASGWRLRQYRVSHLRTHTAQEGGHLARRDRWRRRPRPARLHVVLVVAPGHGPVPAPPPATAFRMTLALAGRGPAGPLPGPHPGIGVEETLAIPTAAAAHSGHRSPPGRRPTRYPTKRRSGGIQRMERGRSQKTQAGFSSKGRAGMRISRGRSGPALTGPWS